MRSKFWIVAVVALFLSMLGVGYFLRSGVSAPALESAPVSIAPVPVPEPVPAHEVIGASVQGRPIDAYRYGDGMTHLLFVGGVHGGYEWNSVALAYAFMDYLDANPSVIPAGITVSVIPSLNPDGVYKVIGKDGRFAIEDVPMETDHSPGRFNAHDVDLNRNFDCKWKPESMWRSKVVSAGTEPFSEPEAAALRDFVAKEKPDAVIFWHSKANSVYASECEGGILPATLGMMNAYANASGYTPVRTFDSYAVSGDAEGWLASIGIPAITVELKTHEAIEWDKNLAGVKALFELYTKEEVPL
ncbi:MAG TPA: M14 family metallopeptidase [Candidatus Paceibacterota bacterium]|nr:M14 family metallopeptidase [Candidatus Paceibacterota bacterium]